MEVIEKCLRSLKTHTSDSEKLAVLMVLSKVSDELTIEKNVIARLYEGIHPEFLLRLLKSKPTEESGNTFNIVGINAVSFFAHRDPGIYFKNRYGELLIDEIFKLFDPSNKSNKKHLYLDAINILLGISKLDEGVYFFLRKKLFTQLSHLFIEENEKNLDLADKVESLFLTLFQYDGKLNPDFLEYLESITKSFMTDQELNKFNHLRVISRLFKIMLDSSIQIEESDKETFTTILKNVNIGSQHIMQSHVKGDVKRSVIVLINYCMKTYDKDWIFDSNLVESVKHFNFLLLTVISVELKMNILYPEKVTLEDPNEDLFLESSLFVSQNILNYICSDCFELNPLATDFDFISKVFKSLKNIMATVFELLTTYKDKITEYFQSPVLLAAISMFSTWVTEETENLRDELEKALPMIMDIIHRDLSIIEETNKKVLYLDILTPAILQIIPEKKIRKILISHDCHVAYIRYFSHLLKNVDTSNTQNVNELESLFHMIHQFTIFNPELCEDNVTIKACINQLLMKISHLVYDLKLSEYCLLEMIVVLLTLVRLNKTYYDDALKKAMLIYIEILYKFSMKKDVTEIWLIAFDNVFECIRMFDELKNAIGSSPYVKKWPVQVRKADKEVKKSITEFVDFIKT